MESLGRGFGAAASDYVAGRPGYLPDAVAWLLAGVTGRVADVGAGTGKLTQVISRLGFDVTAVEPDPAMLSALREAMPGARAVEGAAEALPLADASLGAITFGQAWHWVDVPAASAEAARVLAPGGVLGLIWNVRDESVDWIAALGEAMGASAAESMIDSSEVEVAAPFGALEETVWRWEHPTTRDGVRSMVRSRSYYIAGEPDFRARVDADVEEVLEAMSGERLVVPYVTHVFRTTRP